MNFKTTGILLVVLALLGGYVYVYIVNKPPPPRPKTAFVYQYPMDEIIRMEVQQSGGSTSVVWDEAESQWRYADPTRGEADSGRINGIRLLLSGPGSNRVLLQEAPTTAQLVEYGLANPRIVATIWLKNGDNHRVLLGEQTPDGKNYYTKNANSDTIYLVDVTWGNELARFVNEPPDVKPAAGAV